MKQEIIGIYLVLGLAILVSCNVGLLVILSGLIRESSSAASSGSSDSLEESKSPISFSLSSSASTSGFCVLPFLKMASNVVCSFGFLSAVSVFEDSLLREGSLLDFWMGSGALSPLSLVESASSSDLSESLIDKDYKL